MRLIGLNGKKGAGKDTAGAYLVRRYGFERRSFAAPLKLSAAAALGLPAREDIFEQWKNDPFMRVEVVQYPGPLSRGVAQHAITVREFLQNYGTEAHRDIFGADFWTKQLLDGLDPEGNYVITDARFENECGAIKAAGGMMVVIERPGTDSTDTHASEADLPSELVDVVIRNDGGFEDLYAKLDGLMGAEEPA